MSGSENKTKASDASVTEYIASRAVGDQQSDCRHLMSILRKVTMQEPRVWGPSIVGYGSYRYRYASGRTGESCLTGFAIRGRKLVVYLVAEGPEQAALLDRLGPHQMGKACVYIKRLADIDASVLESLVAGSVAELQRRHGAGRD